MRHPFIFAKNYFTSNCDLSIVEVGVFEGGNAQEFLDYLHPAKVWLVDPWAPYTTNENDGYARWDKEQWDRTYAQVCARFSGYPNVEIVRAFGQDIVHTLPQHVDMVYIDAAHDYLSSKRDIETWYPKVRPGGILSGDDFSYPGVKQAVIEFQEAHAELDVMISPNGTQWWVVKDSNFQYHPDLMKE